MITASSLSTLGTWFFAYATILVVALWAWTYKTFQDLYANAEIEEEDDDPGRKQFLERIGGKQNRNGELQINSDERGVVAEMQTADNQSYYLVIVPKQDFEEEWERKHGK